MKQEISVSMSGGKWIYESLKLHLESKKTRLREIHDEDQYADTANDIVSLDATYQKISDQLNRAFGEEVFNLSDRPIV